MKFICLTIVCTFFFACDNEPIEQNDQIEIEFPSEFCDAIISGNEEFVKTDVNGLCIDLLPQSTDPDPIGHEANLSTLIERIDAVSCLTASLGCYACIFTLPAISEINITILNGDIAFQYVIDIRTPADGILEFVGMH